MTGLLALRERTAHLAGSHLLDGATGEFNVGHVRQLLAPHGVHVVIVGFVGRIQGLIVGRGNPRQIMTLADLVREDVTFINRQEGAGTRVLLEYHLAETALNPAQIRGYDNEATTHLAVATAIARGDVDCGLGIQAAAQTMGLDFVPLFDERYDLIIPVENYESALLAPCWPCCGGRMVDSANASLRWGAMTRRQWEKCWRKSERWMSYQWANRRLSPVHRTYSRR
ncbi:MAG: substrate-binding domain-containing protein [Anaerolineales bacterium]|nr:substrate-binding domain-containing protein [Anaerolineales bacterium]